MTRRASPLRLEDLPLFAPDGAVSNRSMEIVCVNARIGGEAKLFDVRGWGYLTGTGHGGLGLDNVTAYEIQKANARLVAAAPELLAALKDLVGICRVGAEKTPARKKYDAALAAIAKATTPEPSHD